MQQRYDRAAEDLGNIIALEHVNLLIPDQRLATLFYVSGLGLTRDPYLMTGVTNMWINVGRSQLHLPTGKPQQLRGHLGMIVPERAALLRRLAAVRMPLEGTRFGFVERDDFVEATCPWGNLFRCHAPDPRFGRVTLGIPYIAFDVPAGTAEGIARFYREILSAPAVAADDRGRHARVAVGDGQDFIFRETGTELPHYDGHHLQVYVANFSGPHRRLQELGLITEESDQHQYRFQDIVDLDSRKLLFTIEHEVRSLRHPLYARPLVNRNPTQTNTHFAPGHEVWPWSMPA